MVTVKGLACRKHPLSTASCHQLRHHTVTLILGCAVYEMKS